MVLDQLIARLRAEGHQRLVVSWVDAPGGPRPLYERYGFLPTGEIDDGEVVAALSLR
jgi:diamine N-acetyltransferase